MNNKRSREADLLHQLEMAYSEQFKEILPRNLLSNILQKELHDRKAAFLRSQIANFGLDTKGLFNLVEQVTEGRNTAAQRKASAIPHLSDDVLASDRPRGQLGLTKSASDDKNEKKRAHADKSFKGDGGERPKQVLSARNYKTTPEQRAYQRAYYQRKKSKNDQETPALKFDEETAPKSSSQNELLQSAKFRTKLRKANKNLQQLSN